MPRIVAMIPVDLRRWAKAHVTPGTWEFARRLATGHTLPQRFARTARSRAVTVRFGASTAPTAVVSAAGQPLLGLVVSAFRSGETLANHLALVADTFDAHDVPYFVLDAQAERRRVVVVHRDAPRRGGTRLPWQPCGRERRRSTPRGCVARRVRSPKRRSATPRSAPAVRGAARLPGAGQPHRWVPRRATSSAATSSSGRSPASTAPRPATASRCPPAHGWPHGRTAGPTSSSPEEQDVVPRPVDGADMPRLATITRAARALGHRPRSTSSTPGSTAATPTGPAQGGGPARHLTRASVLQRSRPTRAASPRRDELRYSLRSLDMYAPGCATSTSSPTTRCRRGSTPTQPADHRGRPPEIFGDRGRLPTFNSHAIESQLHHIDGLAEHYLYLNDDVFFGRPVARALFFHGNGLSNFFLSTAKIGLGDPSPRRHAGHERGQEQPDLLGERFGVTSPTSSSTSRTRCAGRCWTTSSGSSRTSSRARPRRCSAAPTTSRSPRRSTTTTATSSGGPCPGRSLPLRRLAPTTPRTARDACFAPRLRRLLPQRPRLQPVDPDAQAADPRATSSTPTSRCPARSRRPRPTPAGARSGPEPARGAACGVRSERRPRAVRYAPRTPGSRSSSAIQRSTPRPLLVRDRGVVVDAERVHVAVSHEADAFVATPAASDTLK